MDLYNDISVCSSQMINAKLEEDKTTEVQKVGKFKDPK